ncbi:30S ribosomal protein S27e [Candidatus Pacearchaeota archaeon]|nr:MAG: 30S ribosomal protein S27e [Candidatus Pacearchaeota archaeon]
MASGFVLVKCNCGYEQPVFRHAKSVVKCANCSATLAEPRGGKAKILAKIDKELE